MSFIRSIVLFVSVVLLVAFAYFMGHGLAAGRTAPLIWAVVALAAGAALVFLQARSSRQA